jgi:riboflavin-specific deaminase-like protein
MASGSLSGMRGPGADAIRRNRHGREAPGQGIPGPACWRILRARAGGGATGPAPATDRDAWSLFAPLVAATPRPFVLAQVGQSLDGRIATTTGDARTVSSPAGLAHLHRCRALVDAVVVGIGTVLSDDPQLTVRLVEGRSPHRVVIDPRGRLPAQARMLAADGCRRLVIRADAETGVGLTLPRPTLPPEDGVEIIALPAPAGRIGPAAILAALVARGMTRILVEGGAHTIAAFLDAGLINRIHVAIAPIIIGSGPSGLCLAPIDRLSEALRPQARVFHLGPDLLFDCALA